MCTRKERSDRTFVKRGQLPSGHLIWTGSCCVRPGRRRAWRGRSGRPCSIPPVSAHDSCAIVFLTGTPHMRTLCAGGEFRTSQWMETGARIPTMLLTSGRHSARPASREGMAGPNTTRWRVLEWCVPATARLPRRSLRHAIPVNRLPA